MMGHKQGRIEGAKENRGEYSIGKRNRRDESIKNV
jgi:hypothetical protein